MCVSVAAMPEWSRRAPRVPTAPDRAMPRSGVSDDRGVSERIHDDEPDTSEGTVRALLEGQCPGWAGLPLSYVRTSGTDNAMWRVHVDGGEDVVVRLPRRPGAARTIGHEVELLPVLAGSRLGEVVRLPV